MKQVSADEWADAVSDYHVRNAVEQVDGGEAMSQIRPDGVVIGRVVYRPEGKTYWLYPENMDGEYRVDFSANMKGEQ